MAESKHMAVSEVHSECQRLLTVANRACGGALERLERRVRLESVGEVLGAVWTELVVTESASEASKGAGRMRAREYGPGSEVSAAADSREKGVWRRT